MVLQSLEGLSDRDAASALRTNIAWKVAAGLALDDEGINYSVLTYWRTRLRQSERHERIFDAVREVVDRTGVLKGKRRRTLDSTLLDDAVATPGRGHPVGVRDPSGPASRARSTRGRGRRP